MIKINKVNYFFFFFLKLLKSLSRDGLRLTIVKICMRLLKIPNEIERTKIEVLKILLAKYNYSVAYGPFKGMKFNPNSTWSKYDLITQTLGVYEKHILEKLILFSKKQNLHFIDIGAADGYFAIGAAYSNIFKKVYAFDKSEISLKNIIINININGCRDKVVVKGEANYENLKKTIIDCNHCAVILIDVEGFEFELLDEKMLRCFSNSYVICELHPSLVSNGYEKQDQLLSRCKDFFNISTIQRETYNPNNFEELDMLSDEKRLIVFGEGRSSNMKWLVLEPKL